LQTGFSPSPRKEGQGLGGLKGFANAIVMLFDPGRITLERLTRTRLLDFGIAFERDVGL
jgi:hypothetical protein